MGYRYPETLVEEFLLQGVTDKSTKILDMACGPGNVAFIVGTPFKKNWFPLSGIHLLVPQLREHGYTNIDGLDPSSGLLAAAQEKGISAIFNRNVHISNPRQRLRDIKSWIPGLYQKTICAYVTPDIPTPIENDTYDVLLCSAGMFPGSIVPQVSTILFHHNLQSFFPCHH